MKLTWTRAEQGELTAEGARHFTIHASLDRGYNLLIDWDRNASGGFRWFATEAEAQEAAQRYEDE